MGVNVKYGCKLDANVLKIVHSSNNQSQNIRD